jgi:hypothetical protein
VAGDRRNLVLSASGLGESPGCRLAQAMRAAMKQTGLVALIAEPIAEASRGERLPELRCQVGQVVGWRLGDDSRLRVRGAGPNSGDTEAISPWLPYFWVG